MKCIAGIKSMFTILVVLLVWLTGCCNYSVSTLFCDELSGSLDNGEIRFRLCDSKFKVLDLNAQAVKQYPGIFSDKSNAVPVIATCKADPASSDGKSLLYQLYSLTSTLTLTALPMITFTDVGYTVSTSLPLGQKIVAVESVYKIRHKENESLFPLGLIPVGAGYFHEFVIDGAYNTERLNTVSSAKLTKIKNANMIQAVVHSLSRQGKENIASCVDPANLMRKAMIADESTGVNPALAAVALLEDQNRLTQIAANASNAKVRLSAFKKLSQQSLFDLAIISPELRTKLSAAALIEDQLLLARLVNEIPILELRRAIFKKLTQQGLENLAESATNPSVKYAAQVCIGQQSWSNLFSTSNQQTANIGDVLGAAALVDKPAPTAASVVSACHKYIRRGDESKVPELRHLLLRYGDKRLAEDYLNCGHAGLAEAAREWGRQHGYYSTSGYGSNRVKWGSGR